tara:strand:+ start:115 stop:618 length:504 start_codon:yes stop_codon:yes gene_type:complete
MVKNKKAQAGIIGTVLLILIVITATMVVISFVLPFVRERLEGGDCVNVAGEIEIKNNLQYTCYNSTSNKMSVQIGYGDIENLTNGFQLSIGSSGESQSFEILSGATADSVTMLDGSTTMQLPGKNGIRTYLFAEITSVPESVEIYPILKNNKACDVSDSLTLINICF